MSGENRINTAAPTPLPLPVYNIHCDFQGSGHSGCQSGICQAPPPKYEDVISGEYLKSNYSNCGNLSPGYQTIDVYHPCTYTRTNTSTNTRTNTQLSDHSSQGGYERANCNAGCFFLIIFILVSLFIWRVSLFRLQ